MNEKERKKEKKKERKKERKKEKNAVSEGDVKYCPWLRRH